MLPCPPARMSHSLTLRWHDLPQLVLRAFNGGHRVVRRAAPRLSLPSHAHQHRRMGAESFGSITNIVSPPPLRIPLSHKIPLFQLDLGPLELLRSLTASFRLRP